VNLIHEEDRAPVVEVALLLGIVERRADIRDAGEHRVQGDETARCTVRYDAGESGLAGARRTGEDYGRELVFLYRSPEQAARTDDMILTDEFVECARPHPFRERRGRIFGFRAG
jgi:hypothetical protein